MLYIDTPPKLCEILRRYLDGPTAITLATEVEHEGLAAIPREPTTVRHILDLQKWPHDLDAMEVQSDPDPRFCRVKIEPAGR
jgi:hypothetical protein